MPRKSPVPASEKAIGQRLKSFRESKLISQTAFAAAINISRAQLLNYEEGLAPLPWHVGYVLASRFDVNPRWLVTGNFPMCIRQISRWPEPERASKRTPFSGISKRTPFSKIYDQFLKNAVESDTLTTITFGFNPKKQTSPVSSEIHELATYGWLQRLPETKHREFYLELSAEAERIIHRLNPEDKGPLSLR